MIDLHSHILPLVDDGSRSLSESIAMARHAFFEGINTIVATPHFLDGNSPKHPEEIRQKVSDLRKHFKEENIAVKLYPGSEVHLCPNMAQRILNGEALFLGDNDRYILIEFPFHKDFQHFMGEIDCLRLNGITPVIAHPERNPIIFREKEVLHDLVSMNCPIQVNSTSITGGFGKNIMRCAHELLRLRLVHIIASDAHSPYKRPPALSLAVKIVGNILGDDDKAIEMVRDYPQKILEGKAIDIT